MADSGGSNKRKSAGTHSSPAAAVSTTIPVTDANKRLKPAASLATAAVAATAAPENSDDAAGDDMPAYVAASPSDGDDGDDGDDAGGEDELADRKFMIDAGDDDDDDDDGSGPGSGPDGAVSVPAGSGSGSDCDHSELEELDHPLQLIQWVSSKQAAGANPRSILQSLLSSFGSDVLPSSYLWGMCQDLSRAIARRLLHSGRPKLPHVNTLADVCSLLDKSKNIIVLTGAGLSVAAGIPDFRSKGGIYTRLKREFGMPEPECMFDLRYFYDNPSIFYSFAHELWPGSHKPTAGHFFIAMLEAKGKLLRNYTQNIDDLEHRAGLTKVFQCHGSFANSSCVTCKRTVPGHTLHKQIMSKTIALCPVCHNGETERKPTGSIAAAAGTTPAATSATAPSTVAHSSVGGLKPASDSSATPSASAPSDAPAPAPIARPIPTSALPQQKDSACYGVMKPDIVFFGENLPQSFHRLVEEDKPVVDLVIVMGSSLAVQPVASLISMIPSAVPTILINREVVGQPNKFDVELLGNCDDVCAVLAKQCGWSLPTEVKDTRFPAPPASAAAASAPTTQPTTTSSAAAATAISTATAPTDPNAIGAGEFKFVAPNRYLFRGYTPPAPKLSAARQFPFGLESVASGDDTDDDGSGGGDGKSYQELLWEKRMAVARASARVLVDRDPIAASAIPPTAANGTGPDLDAVQIGQRTASRIRRGVTTSDDDEPRVPATATAAASAAAARK